MGYQCRTCGTWHDDEPNCFICELPLYAMQVPEGERGARVDATPDQCVVDDEHFFILGNLDVRIRDSGGFIRWSVWTSLSRANFLRASELWQTQGRESEPPYFGWLGNQVPGYPDTVNIRTFVHTQPVGVRPQIEVIEENHLLTLEQRDRVGVDRYHELLHEAATGVPGGRTRG